MGKAVSVFFCIQPTAAQRVESIRFEAGEPPYISYAVASLRI